MAITAGKLLGEGISRAAYAFGPRYVLKKAHSEHSGIWNRTEADVWAKVRGTQFEPYFAARRGSSEDGKYLVMERASMTLDRAMRRGYISYRAADEIRQMLRAEAAAVSKQFGFGISDIHRANIGRFGSQWKIIDYAM